MTILFLSKSDSVIKLLWSIILARVEVYFRLKLKISGKNEAFFWAKKTFVHI